MKIEQSQIVRVTDQRPVLRPAGQCGYCPARVGERHAEGCVVPKRAVVVRVVVEYVALVADVFSPEDVERHRNDGSWCASNALRELSEYVEAGDCLCNRAKFEVLRDATPEDAEKVPAGVRAEWART